MGRVDDQPESVDQGGDEYYHDQPESSNYEQQPADDHQGGEYYQISYTQETPADTNDETSGTSDPNAPPPLPPQRQAPPPPPQSYAPQQPQGPVQFPPRSPQMAPPQGSYPPQQGQQPQAYPPPQQEPKPQAYPPQQPQAYPPQQGQQPQAYPPQQTQAYPPQEGQQPQAYPPQQGQPQAYPSQQTQAYPPQQGQQPQAYPPQQGQPQAYPPQQPNYSYAQAQQQSYTPASMGYHQGMPGTPPQAQTGYPGMPGTPNKAAAPGFPMAQQIGTENWSSDLFDCMDDPENAIITACFPCVTFGQIAEILDNGATPCATSGLLYGCIAFLIGCPCILSFGYRSKLRTRYQLIESPAPDWMTHCFCEWCALCQEYRELKSRDLDPAIGWQGNLAKQQQLQMQQQQASMMPPMNQTMMG